MTHHSNLTVPTAVLLLLSSCASPGDLSRAPSDEVYIGLPTEVRNRGKGNALPVAGLDAPLQIIKAVLPNYPSHLMSKQVSGNARVGFIIDEKGNVTDAIVIKASHEDFGKSAVSAILQWKFSVPLKNGKAVGISLVQDFPFYLEL